MNLLEELVRFYYSYDKFQTSCLSPEEAFKYHQTLIDKNRISFVSDGIHLLGYCEYWRLDYHQLGRILCRERFLIEQEDIENGPIVYLANTTIAPEFRRTGVARELTRKFFSANMDAKYFCGLALRKRHEPFKIFKMQEAFKKWFEKEEEVK